MDHTDSSVDSEPVVLKDLQNRYRFERVLGRGGQGTTYLATDLERGGLVAIKALDLAEAASWKDLELFQREGQALRSLDHPGIPRYREEIEGDSGKVYLVMEYVEGESLDAHLRQRGPLSEAELRELLTQALGILAYLGQRHPPIVHRDIKPKNLIRRPDGRLALVDFGGVKLRRDTLGGSTVVGTLGYMAPEQLYGMATPATDLYGLGATLITLATGREPEALPHKGLRVDLDAAVSLSPALKSVLWRLTAPDPDERPSSAAALLAQIRGEPEVLGRRTMSGPVAYPQPMAYNRRWRRRPRWPFVLALFIIMANVGVPWTWWLLVPLMFAVMRSLARRRFASGWGGSELEREQWRGPWSRPQTRALPPAETIDVEEAQPRQHAHAVL